MVRRGVLILSHPSMDRKRCHATCKMQYASRDIGIEIYLKQFDTITSASRRSTRVVEGSEIEGMVADTVHVLMREYVCLTGLAQTKYACSNPIELERLMCARELTHSIRSFIVIDVDFAVPVTDAHFAHSQMASPSNRRNFG